MDDAVTRLASPVNMEGDNVDPWASEEAWADSMARDLLRTTPLIRYH